MFIRKKYIPIMYITLFLHTSLINKQSAIVSKRYANGRLGDQLLTYARAKWLAEKYNLDLYVEYFPYADQLTLWKHDKHYDPILVDLFFKEELFDKHTKIKKNCNILYHFNFRSLMPEWKGNVTGDVSKWEGIINNITFKKLLKEYLSPQKPFTFPQLPDNTTTVALHVRRGGGFDPPLFSKEKKIYADQRYASKFPPHSFYINSLKMLSQMLNDSPIYVHIFTDDTKPCEIKKMYEEIINKPNITFTCRTSENTHDTNVLYDLWYMAQFNYLIRPNSSYSRVAQLLGEHTGVIYPYKLKWKENVLHVKQIIFYQNNEREVIVWEE